MSDIMSPA